MTNERLKELLHNAIDYIDEVQNEYLATEVDDETEWYCNILGITRAELKEVGVDWVEKEEDENEY